MNLDEMIGKVICGDCLEVMKEIPDKSIDLVLTDPPYNISKENDNRDRSKLDSPIMRRKKSLNYDFGNWDNMSREDFLKFTKNWLIECCRVVKDGGTIISFFNKEDISYLGWEGKKEGFRTRTIFTWVKSNPVPSFRKVNYLSATEFIWIGSKDGKPWTFNFGFQRDMSNWYETENSSGYGETEHPTEKPIKLIIKLLTVHSKEGDIILDPFLGSGTTAVACERLGRKWIGIEISEKYCEIARARIKKEQDQLKMF